MKSKIILFIALFPFISSRSATNHYLNDVYVLARLINSESIGEPMRGKIAVGECVVNTMVAYNKTLIEVISMTNRFAGVLTPRFGSEPSSESIKAAVDALDGVRTLPASVVYFYNLKKVKNHDWVNKIRKYRYIVIGNHTFCHDPYLKVKMT
jgi:N-acetylmuramoyl-L-alanine amidase